jgi:AcrR family transcriptional regulator
MTAKQQKIIDAALALFAQEGYRATATSKVAKLAGVSEGLIFRHFTNKEGLLEAIIKEGEARSKMLFADIVLETDPKKVIAKTLEIGLSMSEKQEDNDFWKLQFKLKWELEMYNAHKMEPLETALTAAFTKLNYSQPKQEAKNLLITLDGMAIRHFLQPNFNLLQTINFLKSKYNV